MTTNPVSLSERARPESLDEFVGQNRIFSKDSALFRIVQARRFTSLIFWGPPGTGKTTLARLIGSLMGMDFINLSAVQHGVADIRKAIQQAESRLAQALGPSLIFMDEVHRLRKDQQEVFLPVIESGLVRFIGATTENPSFEVQKALLSRSIVFRFERHSIEDLLLLQRRALERHHSNKSISERAARALSQIADGDGRRVLNLLDSLLATLPDSQEQIDLEDLVAIQDTLQLRFDKDGDDHFDLISALIKSIRASHPDAAVYYLARLLEAGEDPMFVARRLVIAASEDVGNAHPTALVIATNGMSATHLVGMPEARIILSQVVTYLACSPKSNRSYLAIGKALEDVKSTGSLEVPMHLRNAPTTLMKQSGYGKGYIYPHDDPEGARHQEYLPQPLANRRYYEPKASGTEKQIKAYLDQFRSKQQE